MLLVDQFRLKDRDRLQEVDVQTIGKLERRDDVSKRAEHQEPSHAAARPQRAANRNGVPVIDIDTLPCRIQRQRREWTRDCILLGHESNEKRLL